MRLCRTWLFALSFFFSSSICAEQRLTVSGWVQELPNQFGEMRVAGFPAGVLVDKKLPKQFFALIENSNNNKTPLFFEIKREGAAPNNWQLLGVRKK